LNIDRAEDTSALGDWTPPGVGEIPTREDTTRQPQ
jgi:hypothetical protein